MSDLIQKFNQLLSSLGEQTLEQLKNADSLEQLEQIRVSVLGKKGSLSEVLKALGQLDPTERPKMGAVANILKTKIESEMDARKEQLDALKVLEQIKNETIDVSLPARKTDRGSLHPVTLTTRRLIQVFSRLGFDLMTGPEVETDYMCFEAVNIPADHPARDMQDTFFISPGVLLRTQTSAIQMRALRSKELPLRIICPGAVYRNDSDATHSPMFHQLEGLWIDRNVKMSDLKGVLEFFAKELFGKDVKIRLRPSYFPFVEPGAEVDVSCFKCGSQPQATCKICKGSGWLEILGAGMVHPRLFELAGLSQNLLGNELGHDQMTGFAFGLGIDRIAMLVHEIPDLRLMFENQVKFLNQF